MDEVEVQVVQLQLLQGIVEGVVHLALTVVIVPDLAGDEELVTGDIAGLKRVSERLA